MQKLNFSPDKYLKSFINAKEIFSCLNEKIPNIKNSLNDFSKDLDVEMLYRKLELSYSEDLEKNDNYFLCKNQVDQFVKNLHLLNFTSEKSIDEVLCIFLNFTKNYLNKSSMKICSITILILREFINCFIFNKISNYRSCFKRNNPNENQIYSLQTTDDNKKVLFELIYGDENYFLKDIYFTDKFSCSNIPYYVTKLIDLFSSTENKRKLSVLKLYENALYHSPLYPKSDSNSLGKINSMILVKRNVYNIIDSSPSYQIPINQKISSQSIDRVNKLNGSKVRMIGDPKKGENIDNDKQSFLEIKFYCTFICLWMKEFGYTTYNYNHDNLLTK